MDSTEFKTRIQEHYNQIGGINRVLVIIGIFLLAAIHFADNNIDIATSLSLRALTIILLVALLFGVFQYVLQWITDRLYYLLNKKDNGQDIFYPEILKLVSESFFVTKIILTISAYVGLAIWLFNHSLVDVIYKWSIPVAFITLGVVFIGMLAFYVYDVKNNLNEETKNKLKESRIKTIITIVSVICIIIAFYVLISICLPKVMVENSTKGETIEQTIDDQTAIQDSICCKN